MIDDSELLHYAAGYDPAKAREYYLRTRKLKGRRKGVSEEEFRDAATGNEGKYDRPGNTKNEKAYDARQRKERRAVLEKKQEELRKRLERLQQVLRELVEDAKKRSGVEIKKSATDRKTSESSSTESKTKSKASSKSEPLTESEKREKAKNAREAYEKENGPTKSNGGGQSLSTDVKALERKIQDIRAKIEKALEDARSKSSQSNNQTASKGR
jgi:hypothetical protein